MKTQIYFIHALSPLHAGTGQGIEAIDLPIAREKATNLPIVPGSSIKGVLRAACKGEANVAQVFGPDTKDSSEHASSVSISDACLLAMPVRSLAGTFAWVSSPYVLRRLQRDAKIVGAAAPESVPSMGEMQTCLAPADSKLLVRTANAAQVYLEELDLTPKPDESAAAWAQWLAEHLFPVDPSWQAEFSGRFCVVHDDLFGYLLRTSTEITARIKLQEDAKTVARGGLWYEESLPTESILWGMAAALPVKATPEEVFALLHKAAQGVIQIGGNATTGSGLCQLHIGRGN